MSESELEKKEKDRRQGRRGDSVRENEKEQKKKDRVKKKEDRGEERCPVTRDR